MSAGPLSWRLPGRRWLAQVRASGTARVAASGWVLAALGIALLVAALLIAASQGAYAVRWQDLWASGAGAPEGTAGARVFWHIRAPRLLMAVLAGAALGMAGALAQGLFRNPLADPGLIGVSSGAALGAAATIVLGGALTRAWGAWPVMAAAFGGGLLATAVAWRLAHAQGELRVGLLLLVGVAVNALAGAGLGLLSQMADEAQLRSLTFWLLGSLGDSRWAPALACGVVVALVLCAAPWQARALNVLALGEAQARLKGVPVPQVQRRCVLAIALGVGAVTALTGIIGFVGLLAPHAARLLLGPDHRRVLPASALLGAVLVLLADAAARTVLAPQELPLGVLTGLLGAPAFLWMLRRRFNAP